MRRTTRENGISLIEVVVTVAIIAVFAAVAVPQLVGVMAAQDVKRSARNGADLLLLARSEAIRTGNRYLVVWGNPGDVDPGGTALQDADGNFVPMMVVDDGPPATANCKIDAGESLEYLQAGGEVSWGVAEASAQAPGDGGTGAIGTGWTFEDPGSNPVRWILFRPDGIPVAFTVAAGTCNQVFGTGSGTGAFYINDGKRDYAIVLNALGNVQVRRWLIESGTWSD